MAPRTAAYDAVVAAPFGALGIVVADDAVRRIEVLRRPNPPRRAVKPFAAEVSRQLAAYFRSSRYRFRLNVAPQGTAFQRRVWKAMAEIPCGETRTYGELAETVGSGPRAVAGACRTNPLSIVVPCHRVVAQNGVGGYMGETSGPSVRIKQWLLEHERRG